MDKILIKKLEKMLKDTDNDLKKYVIEYILDDCGNDDEVKTFFKDLSYGGGQSGFIGSLVYYSDTKAFFIKYMDEIDEVREEMENELGEPPKIGYPLYNSLAWIAFERTAYKIETELGL